MTAIVGLVDSRHIWIGGDSAGTSESGLLTLREDRKVFFLNSPDQSDYHPESPTLLVGGTTSYRFLDLLRFKLDIPAYSPEMHPKRYLVTVFVDALRECLKSSGYSKVEEGEEQGGEFLIGWQGKLYHICESYQVGEASIGYDAVGSGEAISLGVMFATQERDMVPEKRVQLALEAASYHCRGVRPPFTIEKLSVEDHRMRVNKS